MKKAFEEGHTIPTAANGSPVKNASAKSKPVPTETKPITSPDDKGGAIPTAKRKRAPPKEKVIVDEEDDADDDDSDIEKYIKPKRVKTAKSNVMPEPEDDDADDADDDDSDIEKHIRPKRVKTALPKSQPKSMAKKNVKTAEPKMPPRPKADSNVKTDDAANDTTVRTPTSEATTLIKGENDDGEDGDSEDAFHDAQEVQVEGPSGGHNVGATARKSILPNSPLLPVFLDCPVTCLVSGGES